MLGPANRLEYTHSQAVLTSQIPPQWPETYAWEDPGTNYTGIPVAAAWTPGPKQLQPVIP